MQYLDTLSTFDLESLPNLDLVTLGALERFSTATLPKVDFASFQHPLVLGSGNALAVGRILFNEHDALFADESTYLERLRNAREGIRTAVIISASGRKHSVAIAKELALRNITATLFTTNSDAPAMEHVDTKRVFVFPKNREPYTYNTSTYLGMLFAKTGEDPNALLAFIEKEVASALPDTLASYTSFYFIVPENLHLVRPLILTKFDELFGPMVAGRAFTYEQSKHAKTVVNADTECFVSFGKPNEIFGNKEARITIPLPEDVGYAGMMAIAYYVVGRIQAAHPPYFKKHIAAYVKNAVKYFGHELNAIVE